MLADEAGKVAAKRRDRSSPKVADASSKRTRIVSPGFNASNFSLVSSGIVFPSISEKRPPRAALVHECFTSCQFYQHLAGNAQDFDCLPRPAEEPPGGTGLDSQDQERRSLDTGTLVAATRRLEEEDWAYPS